MTRHYVDATYAIETKGPLHVGTGHGAVGLHRTMLRDHLGVPYIPGSAIKGRARYSAMRICAWMGLPVIKDAVGHARGSVERSPNGPYGKRDVLTRIFGCAWARATLRFSDARTDPPSVDDSPMCTPDSRLLRQRAYGLRELRTGAARSRLLGTVSNGRLYQMEVAPPGLIFQGEIRGYLDGDEPADCGKLVDYPLESLVLWLALHLMVEDGIGGNKSAGSGKLAWAMPERLVMKIDGIPFFPTEDEASAALGLLPAIEEARAET